MVEVVDRRSLTRPEMHTWAVDRRKSGSNRERLNAGSMDAHPDPQGWTIPRSIQGIWKEIQRWGWDDVLVNCERTGAGAFGSINLFVCFGRNRAGFACLYTSFLKNETKSLEAFARNPCRDSLEGRRSGRAGRGAPSPTQRQCVCS